MLSRITGSLIVAGNTQPIIQGMSVASNGSSSGHRLGVVVSPVTTQNCPSVGFIPNAVSASYTRARNQ